MAKQRYISTSIWDDDWFVEELSQAEKLFYFYLLTNEHTNIAGIYKLSVRKIALETGFEKDEVEEHFKTLEKSKKVYYRENHIIMVNWPKHQNWESSERIHKGIRAILLKETPQCVLKAIHKESIPYAYPIDSLSKGINSVGIEDAYPSNYLDSDSDSNSDSDSIIHSRNSDELPDEPDESQEPITVTMEQATTLAHLLEDLHKAEDPQYQGKPDQWAKDIEKLIRLDKRGPDEVEKVLRWAKAPGSFWFPNVVSGRKLREKYPTLKAQMERDGPMRSTTQRPENYYKRRAL